MNKTTLSSAIALCLGSAATNVSAVDMNVTSLVFGTASYVATGTLTDTANDLGLFQSVDNFFGHAWAAAGVAHFSGFDGSFVEDLNTAPDSANITNGTLPTDFGAFSQTITPNPDGDPNTNDFTWSGISATATGPVQPSPFSYTFTLTSTQVAWGNLFNWNTNGGIAVLSIMDCGPTGTTCTALDVPEIEMANGPFAGSRALFSGIGSDFPPEVGNSSVSTIIDTLINIDALANAVDRDETLPVTSPLAITTVPADGTAVVNVANDGTIDYTPVGLADGESDSFEYTVTDSDGNVSAPAAVTINITAAVNTPPVASDAPVSVDEDSSVVININTVATDPESPPQILTFVNVSAAANGTVVLDGTNENLTYTPNADYNGPDSFTYSVNDGLEDSAAPGTITVTVNPVNDAPVCVTASLATATDTTLVVTGSDLAANCTDIDGDTVTYVSLSATQPTNATLSDDGADTLTIVPNTGFTGDDGFMFNVTDGNVGGEITTDASLKIGTVFGNFTMLDVDSSVFGGTNDIIFNWDGQYNTDETDTTVGHMTIESAKPQPFFSFYWTARRVRVYSAGHYEFDTACSTAQYEAGTTDCGGTKIVMDVPAGFVGGHILFDWGKPDAGSPCGVANCDIDVVNVWEPNGVWDRHGQTGIFNQLWDGAAGVAPDPDGTWELVSTDVNGDDINGAPMIDGPFQGLYPNFSFTPSGQGEAKPPLVITAPDTKLGDGLSMNIISLFASLVLLLGLRHVGRNKQ